MQPLNRNFVRFTLGFFIIILLGIAGVFAANWYEANLLENQAASATPENTASAAGYAR